MTELFLQIFQNLPNTFEKFCKEFNFSGVTTCTLRVHYVVRRRPSFNKFLRHFHVLFQYNFDGQKTHVVSQTFVGIISLVEKSTLLPRTFFDVMSLVEKSTLLTLTFSDVILMVEKSTLFARTFYDKISMSKNSTLQANKNIRRGFPLLVTLKSCLLQYYSS